MYPEYGFYGLIWTRETIQPYLEHVPNITSTNWNPCNHPIMPFDTEVQHNLSCMAKHASIYIVANIGAQQPCTKSDPKCPPDLHFQYSANVVYGPNGDFIARYFKYNLNSDESYFDKPSQPDITTFDTPFGTFGTFTSTDILFHEPTVTLIKVLNVTNIAYPMAWQDRLPIMAAIEFHSAFAEGMRINLLAANLHLPTRGYHGSGLYWPTGTSLNASYFYNDHPDSNGSLVVEVMTPFIIPPQSDIHVDQHTVSKFLERNINRQEGVVERMSADTNRHTNDADIIASLNSYEEYETVKITINNDTYTAVLLRHSYGEPTVCQGRLCCSASYEGNFAKGELYALGAFDGIHTDGSSYYLQACTFIKCATSSRESCGKPAMSSESYMSKMSFVGNFTTKYVFPEVLTDQNGTPGLVTTSWLYQGSVIIDVGINGGPLAISMLARDYSHMPS